MSNKITSILPISGSLTVSGSILSSGNIDATGYSITASTFSGTITSASYAGTSSLLLGSIVSASYALTSSYSTLAQNVLGSISSASFATVAYTASYATASWTGSNTAFNAVGAITASQGFSGSIQSASFASSSYTTLTASAANSLTFTVVSASYATNAGNANNASFAPNGFTITGTLAVSGNANHTGYAVTASAFSGSIASASFASSSYTTLSSSYALTASFALNGGGGSSTSASYASTASVGAPGFFVSGGVNFVTNAVLINNFTGSNVNITITGSTAQSGNITVAGGNITSSLGFSGSIASASFASSSYTTLTASAANSLTFTLATASYAVNAGTAQNANFAPNGFTITGSLLVSGNTIHQGYAVTASAFSGSIASASFASSSYTTLTASAATSITFPIISASYATNAGSANNASFAPNGFTVTGSLLVSGNIDNHGYQVTASFFKGDGTQVTNVVSSSYAITSSYASVAQSVLGSITSASYAGTASLGTPTFIVSGTLGVTGSISLNSSIATASIQILSNSAPFLNSGSYIELFDAVTDGDANKGNVNIAAGIPATIITSGSTQAGINFYTSGTLQWRVGPSGNLDGMNPLSNIRMTGSVSASAFSGSIQSASFASSSYTTLSSSYSLSGSYATTSSLAITASFALSNAGTVTNATSASFSTYTYTASYATASWTGSATAFNAVGAITASQGFSGSIASSSFASSSYTTLTASAANSLTFTVVSASYATNAGNANNANFAPAGFAITGTLAVSGNINDTGYQVTASFFKGDGTQVTNVVSSSYSVTSSYATVAQTLLGSVTSASYAATASYATPVFIASGTLGVTGSIQLNSATATASLQLLSNTAPTYISGAFIELFDVVTNGDDQKGDVNIWAGLPQTAILSGSQGAVKIYTSGNLQWIFNSAGNLDGTGHFLSASALSGSGANVTGVISSSYALTSSYAGTASVALNVGSAISSSYATNAGNANNASFAPAGFTISGALLVSGNTIHQGYAITASAFSGSIASASFASSSYTTLSSSYSVTSSYAVTMSFVTQSSIASASAGNPNFFANQITASVGINIASGALFTTISNPPTPAAGTYQVWARKISGRTMLKGQGPSGVDVVYQPALFGNMVAVISAGSSAGSGSSTINKPNAFGCSTEQSGSIFNLNNDLDTIGFMTNVSGAMIIANTTSSCGVTTRDRQVITGFNAAGANGYFFNARLNFPDQSASYAGNLTQGIRAFVGLSATKLGTVCTSGTLGQNQTPYYPTVSSSLAGFFYSNVTGFGNTWKFAVSTGVTSSIIDTNVLFTTQSVYDFYIFSAPSGSMSGSAVPNWRIDVFNTGSQITTEGGPFGGLSPSPSQSLYAGAWLTAFQSTPRTFNYQRIYIESDR